MTLTREALLAITRPPPRLVVLEEGNAFVRMLSARERDQFEISISGGELVNIRAKLLALTVCDADGERVFTDADIDALGELPAPVADRLFAMAKEINAFSDADADELKKK